MPASKNPASQLLPGSSSSSILFSSDTNEPKDKLTREEFALNIVSSAIHDATVSEKRKDSSDSAHSDLNTTDVQTSSSMADSCSDTSGSVDVLHQNPSVVESPGDFTTNPIQETLHNNNYDVYYFQQNWAKIMDLATQFVDTLLNEAKIEYMSEETKQKVKTVPQISVEIYDDGAKDVQNGAVYNYAENLSDIIVEDAIKSITVRVQANSDTCIDDIASLQFPCSSADARNDNSASDPVYNFASELVQTSFDGAWDRLTELANYKPEAGLYEEQLFAFATDFVQDVMDSAILEAEGFSYITRVNKYPSFQSQCSTDCKSESDYFLEEFGSGARKSSLSVDDMKNFAADLARRSSSDSFSDSQRRDSCGFKDTLLASFANELIRSNPNSPSLEMFETRRGSRDSLNTRRSSGISEGGLGSSPSQKHHNRYLAASPNSLPDTNREPSVDITPGLSPDIPSVSFIDVTKEDEQHGNRSHSDLGDYSLFNSSKRVVSFEDITNQCRSNDEEVTVSVESLSRSHEAILEWFNASRRASEGEASYVSSNSQSTHIEWFVEDLLVESFRAAFLDLFGESYIDYCFTKSDPHCSGHWSSNQDVKVDGLTSDFVDNFIQTVMQDALELACLNTQESFGVCDSEDNSDATRIIENVSENLTNEILQEALQYNEPEAEITQVNMFYKLLPAHNPNFICVLV